MDFEQVDALDAISAEAYAAAVKRGHYKQGRSIESQLLHLFSEVCEISDEVDRDEWRFIDTTGEKPEGILIELADVVITAVSIAKHLGGGIGDAVRLKLAHEGCRED